MARRRQDHDSAESVETNAEETTARPRVVRELMNMPTHKMSSAMHKDPPKRKYGLLKATIGTTHVVQYKDSGGKKRQAQFEVRNLARHQDVEGKAICITCKKTYADVQELQADHLDHHELVKAMEVHVWCLWSDAEAPPASPVGIAASVPAGAPGGGVVVNTVPLGLLSDE